MDLEIPRVDGPIIRMSFNFGAKQYSMRGSRGEGEQGPGTPPAGNSLSYILVRTPPAPEKSPSYPASIQYWAIIGPPAKREMAFRWWADGGPHRPRPTVKQVDGLIKRFQTAGTPTPSTHTHTNTTPTPTPTPTPDESIWIRACTGTLDFPISRLRWTITMSFSRHGT